MSRLKELEKRLEIAKSILEETKEVKRSLDTIDPIEGDLFEKFIERLKFDFELIRNNLIMLVERGQELLRELQTLSPLEMKPQFILAVSELQKTIGQNTRLLMDLYKEISEIEERKQRAKIREEEIELKRKGLDSKLSIGKAENVQNIVFTGKPDELLKLISNKKELEEPSKDPSKE